MSLTLLEVEYIQHANVNHFSSNNKKITDLSIELIMSGEFLIFIRK